MLRGMLDERPPDVELLHVDTVELAELIVRRLEEGPLIAFEVDGDRERHDRKWLETERMEQLNPNVDVAILLHPDALFGMQRVARVTRHVQARNRH